MSAWLPIRRHDYLPTRHLHINLDDDGSVEAVLEHLIGQPHQLENSTFQGQVPYSPPQDHIDAEDWLGMIVNRLLERMPGFNFSTAEGLCSLYTPHLFPFYPHFELNPVMQKRTNLPDMSAILHRLEESELLDPEIINRVRYRATTPDRSSELVSSEPRDYEALSSSRICHTVCLGLDSSKFETLGLDFPTRLIASDSLARENWFAGFLDIFFLSSRKEFTAARLDWKKSALAAASERKRVMLTRKRRRLEKEGKGSKGPEMVPDDEDIPLGYFGYFFTGLDVSIEYIRPVTEEQDVDQDVEDADFYVTDWRCLCILKLNRVNKLRDFLVIHRKILEWGFGMIGRRMLGRKSSS